MQRRPVPECNIDGLHNNRLEGPNHPLFSIYRVREKKILNLQHRRLTVRPADSWHQPDFKDMDELGWNEAVEQDEAGTILRLNDDCLLKIFEYLPMTDLIQAEKACWRFRSIAELIYKSYKVFDSDDYDMCSLVCLRNVLYNIGPYVQSLKANFRFNSTRNGQLLRFAALYCTDLKVLQLCGIEVTYKIRNIHNMFRHLRKLEIGACSVSDHDLSYLLRASENKTIEELSLSNNQKLTGKFLVHFRNIKTASFYSCSNIQPFHFIAFVRENPGIEDLNIILCDRVDAKCIETIAETLTGLKRLSMNNAYVNIYSSELFSPLTNLKSLTHLTIRYVNYGSVDSLLLGMSEAVPLEYLDISSGQLSKQGLLAIQNFKTLRALTMSRKKDCDDDVMRQIARLRTLEELHIAACNNVTNDGVEEVVRQNVNIRFLDLSACYNMSPDLVPTLVEITKDRPQMLTLKVGDSSIPHEYVSIIGRRGN